MVLWWVVALNVGLAATQIVIGTSVRSLALVSDGAHTLSDALAAYVAWLAEAVHKRPADEALPFGYARATTVGALVNVAALEALCVSIGLSALCRLWRPEPVADLRALACASALGVAVNGLAACLALCGVRGAHAHLGGRATRGYAPASEDDCACCVELEEAKVSDGDGGLGAGLVEAPKVGVGRAALVAHLAGDAASCLSGQHKRAKFPTSKAPISAVLHSFRLIFGRAIISRNGLEACMLFPERARAEHSC